MKRKMIVKFKGAIKIGLQKFQTISTYEEFCLTFGNCYACLGDIQNTEINPKKQKQKTKEIKVKVKVKRGEKPDGNWEHHRCEETSVYSGNQENGRSSE